METSSCSTRLPKPNPNYFPGLRLTETEVNVVDRLERSRGDGITTRKALRIDHQ